MKFQYQRYGRTLRPVIRLRVKNGETVVPYDVLIDSGADDCLFDIKLARQLGLDLETGIMRKGTGIVGQTVMYYLHEVEIEIAGIVYKTQIGFVDRDEIQYGLAGQRGFFDLFKITFDLRNEEIELQSGA